MLSLKESASNLDQDSYDRYKQDKFLGSGSFGYVHLVIDTQLKPGDENSLLAFFLLFNIL